MSCDMTLNDCKSFDESWTRTIPYDLSKAAKPNNFIPCMSSIEKRDERIATVT